ncbi:DUF983 domain-containing protein [Sphingopyxis chilensis]
MPDFIQSPFDRPNVKKTPPPSPDLVPEDACPALPATGREAIVRGILGRCPRCNEARLFARFLKPIAHCPRCAQDWTRQQADDFPAYVSIFLTGHIVAPVLIALVQDTALSLAALTAIIVPLMLVLMIALLQPAKGAVIALQWWFGMHGFQKERPAEPHCSNDE